QLAMVGQSGHAAVLAGQQPDDGPIWAARLRDRTAGRGSRLPEALPATQASRERAGDRRRTAASSHPATPAAGAPDRSRLRAAGIEGSDGPAVQSVDPRGGV